MKRTRWPSFHAALDEAEHPLTMRLDHALRQAGIASRGIVTARRFCRRVVVLGRADLPLWSARLIPPLANCLWIPAPHQVRGQALRRNDEGRGNDGAGAVQNDPLTARGRRPITSPSPSTQSRAAARLQAPTRHEALEPRADHAGVVDHECPGLRLQTPGLEGQRGGPTAPRSGRCLGHRARDGRSAPGRRKSGAATPPLRRPARTCGNAEPRRAELHDERAALRERLGHGDGVHVRHGILGAGKLGDISDVVERGVVDWGRGDAHAQCRGLRNDVERGPRPERGGVRRIDRQLGGPDARRVELGRLHHVVAPRIDVQVDESVVVDMRVVVRAAWNVAGRENLTWVAGPSSSEKRTCTVAWSMPTPSFVTTVNGSGWGRRRTPSPWENVDVGALSRFAAAPVATATATPPMPRSRRRRDMPTGVGRLTDAHDPATAS